MRLGRARCVEAGRVWKCRCRLRGIALRPVFLIYGRPPVGFRLSAGDRPAPLPCYRLGRSLVGAHGAPRWTLNGGTSRFGASARRCFLSAVMRPLAQAGPLDPSLRPPASVHMLSRNRAVCCGLSGHELAGVFEQHHAPPVVINERFKFAAIERARLRWRANRGIGPAGILAHAGQGFRVRFFHRGNNFGGRSPKLCRQP